MPQGCGLAGDVIYSNAPSAMRGEWNTHAVGGPHAIDGAFASILASGKAVMCIYAPSAMRGWVEYARRRWATLH